jgi:hypothetical protein
VSPARDLKRLEALRLTFGAGAAREKAALLARLTKTRFSRSSDVLRLHEAAAFAAAYPDDARVRAAARRLLDGFARREDLALHRDALADSGIAGTQVHYNFFWMMARWLARRLAGRLSIDWERSDAGARLAAALPLLTGGLAAEAVKRTTLPVRTLIDRLRGRTPDAAWLAARIEARFADDHARQHVHDTIDNAYVLAPGAGFPSRSTAGHARAPLVYRRTAPDPSRPDLARELARQPRRVRACGRPEGRALVELSREAMLTRARDLVAFSWGNEDDVVMVDDGDGLAFAIIGSLPAHRLPLPAVHGWIILRNRVPVGYVQTDTLLKASELSFNVFETFRGAEAGYLFARVLATCRHLFDARAFSLEPYQLGDGNDEGITSGAWWFYYKLGFRPIAEGPKRALASELSRMARDPSHRSRAATLKRLARGHLVWEPEAGRRAWLPWVPALGLKRTCAAPEEARRAANTRFGISGALRWSADERGAWTDMAPLALALPGVERWSRDERRAAVDALKSKGAKSESDYLWRIDAHSRLTLALQTLLMGQGAFATRKRLAD